MAKKTPKKKKTVGKNKESGFKLDWWGIGSVVAVTLVWSFIYTNVIRAQSTLNPRTLGIALLAFPIMLLFYFIISRFVKSNKWSVGIAAILTPISYNLLQVLQYGNDAYISMKDYLPVAIWDVITMGVAIVLGLIIINYIRINWPKKWYIK